MNEVEKYTKLWAAGYGNNYDIPKGVEVIEFMRGHLNLEGGETILDVGGGDGRLKKFFPNQEYISLDLAPNSGADIIADICTWWDETVYDWVISTDVMEHIPTDRVSSAISSISYAATIGAIFMISNRPDRMGRIINEPLHLTVQPPVWWVGMLAQEFKSVVLLREVKPDYCIIIARH